MPSSRQRERELARARQQRREAARAAARARARRRNAAFGAVLATLLVVGAVVGLAVTLARRGGTTPAAAASATPVAGCTAPGSATPKRLHFAKEPPLTVARTTYTATLRTNCGPITLALNAREAPHAVNSFVFLAGKGYFDGTRCHRLTTEGIYVVQCGDPTGTGRGGPGYEFRDENLRGATYPAGTVAMANSGPNTNGSQFFLVYRDTKLPPSYTPFGRVTSGLDVLSRVAAAGTTPAGDGAPKQPLVLRTVTVARR